MSKEYVALAGLALVDVAVTVRKVPVEYGCWVDGCGVCTAGVLGVRVDDKPTYPPTSRFHVGYRDRR